MKLAAVIFDFSGVIVDVEPVHQAALSTVLADHGIPLDSATYDEQYLGLTDFCLFQKVLDGHAGNSSLQGTSISTLLRAKSMAYQRHLNQEVPLGRGVAALVLSLVRTPLPIAIASGARHNEIDHLLHESGLAQHFPVVISADDVPRGKPHPAPFLAALDGLRRSNPSIRNDATIVLEDAPHGVAAARAAGMCCIGLSRSPGNLALADAVIPTLEGHDAGSLARLVGLENP